MNVCKVKYVSLALLLASSLLLVDSMKAQGNYEAEKIWASEKEFKVPESVFYDQEREMIYVSNINGNPTEKDDNGFITQMDMNGNIHKLRWITGLHAPKGMGMIGNKLYVTDINRVAEIDVVKGEIVRFFEAQEAKFLNDITFDEQGRIYVSDMMTGAVYRISNGSISLWLSAGQIEKSNGLNFRQGKIYLGASKKIYTIDPQSKSIEKLADVDVSVDGLELNKHGDIIFSDWNGKVQMIIRGAANKQLLFNTASQKINAADIYYVKEKDILLVPTFFDDRVMAYKISRDE